MQNRSGLAVSQAPALGTAKRDAFSSLPELNHTGETVRVLIVEDESADVELELLALRNGGFDASADVIQTPEEFTNQVRKASYDVILADYKLPGWNGMESVEILRREGLDVPVVLVSGALGELRAVECIKQGASDYVLKDHLARLPESVRRAVYEKKLRKQNKDTQEELAPSNQELEQFAYVASHDLQEPLRMVATYTQLLAERYRGKLDGDADKYIHYAVDGALRMQALIQDVLAYSRAGRQVAELDSTDCNVLVDVAAENLEAAIRESRAKVSHDSLPAILADRSQLLQVFQNLIGNAIKFHGAGAGIHFHTLPAEAQHHLQRIQEGTKRMGLPVDDLLNLARVGRRDLSVRVVALKSIVEEVIAELEPDCKGRQVEWKIGDLPSVEGDSGLIRQIFQNLLSNSLKFSRLRSQAIIEVGEKRQDEVSVLFVRDNGVGFNMKYADKLFGVFQRFHHLEDFEGTGVGLAIVQRIVQKHGGDIWAEAELDKGATFYFTLRVSGKIEFKTKVAAAGDKA